MHMHAARAHNRSGRVIQVAGKTQPTLDGKGTYKKACALLAKDLGWGLGEVYSMWREVTMIHEFEQCWPRSCAEWQAMHDVRAMLYKPGEAGN